MDNVEQQPATKRDLNEAIANLEKRLDEKYATKEDLKEAIAGLEERLEERYATKEDLKEAIAGLEERTDGKRKKGEQRMDTKLDELADMIRSLGMKMDDFNKDRVYRDEVQDLENRVKRLEQDSGLT